MRILLRVPQQGVGQRFETRLPGNQGLAAPLRFIGQVQILEPVLGVGAENGALQFGTQLALLGNAVEDGLAALFHLPQVVQALLQLAHLGVVQGAGGLLAIAGDEGHRGAFIE